MEQFRQLAAVNRKQTDIQTLTTTCVSQHERARQRQPVQSFI